MTTNFLKDSIDTLQIKIQKIDDKISIEQNKIKEIKIKYETSLIKHRQQCIQNILKTYKFPGSKQIILLQEQVNNIIEKIKYTKTKWDSHSDNHKETYENLYELICEKQDIMTEMKLYENQIKEATKNSGFIKQNQINSLFDINVDDNHEIKDNNNEIKDLNYIIENNKNNECEDDKYNIVNNFDEQINITRKEIYNDDNIKLDKWHQRKQILIKNGEYLNQKNKIKQQLRDLDRNIKSTYWKIASAEELKNETLQKLCQDFETNRYNVQHNVNPVIYRHLDVPVNRILTQDTYLKFRKELKNSYKTIETKYQTQQLQYDLAHYLEKYQNISLQYNKIDTGDIKLIDISTIYKKYKILKQQLDNVDNNLIDKKYKHNAMNNILVNIDNKIVELKSQKSYIMKYLKKYEDHNEEIVEERLEMRTKRFRIKASIQHKKDKLKINQKIVELNTKKNNWLNELVTLKNLVNQIN
jgi:hypothetical protein